MLNFSGDGTVMVQGQDRVVAYAVTLGLPGSVYPTATLYVAAIEVQASTTSDMPDGTRLIAGYPTRTAQITLAGLVDQTDETKTAAWLFNPYSAGSPLYQKQVRLSTVTIDLGVQPAGTPELVRQFTGTIDDWTYNGDGTVTVQCLDTRNNMRTSVDIPAVVTEPPFNAGLTSEYAVDALLRGAFQGTISSWPAQRASVVFAAGMRTSVWPEVGSLVSSITAPQYLRGVFGSALGMNTIQSGGAITAATNWAFASTVTGADLFYETWLTDSTATEIDLIFANALSSATLAADFTITTGAIQLTPSFGDAPTTLASFTLAPGGSYIAARLHWPSGWASWSTTVYVDGNTYTASGTSVSPRSGNYGFLIAQILGGSIEAVQVTSESTPASNFGFVPQALLDPSLNTLQVIPEITGDPFTAIQAIADAELAVAGFNGAGVFLFKNRVTLASSPSVRTVSSLVALAQLQIQSGAEAYANRIQVPYTGWSFAAAGLVWSLDVPQVVRAGRTRNFTVAIPSGSLVTAPDTSFTVPTTGHTTTDGGSYYRASIDKAGTVERTGGVSVTLTQTNSTTLVVTVANTGSQDCWLVSPSNYTDIPAGTPSLWVGGVLVTQGSQLISDTGAVGAGEVLYQFPSNDWVQDQTTADTLAAWLLKDQSHPTPQLTNVAITPDPRLELTDRVEIQDVSRSGMDEYAVIWGSTISLSIDGDTVTYTQTLDARPVAAPGGWILGVPGRSELGQTTYVY
jgi:hypothetical protein